MDTVYTIVQVVLGLMIGGAGFGHYRAVTTGNYGQMTWLLAVPRTLMLTIAALEILAAVSLIGTVITGTTWLAALTAACVLLLMVFAMIFHARRPGEVPNIAFNAVFAVLALVVLYANLT
jgi:DoxX-like family